MNATSKLRKGIGYTGADLVTRRSALGLVRRSALQDLFGYSVRIIDYWEHDLLIGDELDEAMIRMSRLERDANRITKGLVENSRETGVITTYRTDDDAAAAGATISVSGLRQDVLNPEYAPDIALHVADARFHRVCAGRALSRNPDAELVAVGLPESDLVSIAQRSRVLVQLSMLGLSTTSIESAIGLPQRVLQNWLAASAKDGRLRGTLHADQFQRIDEITEARSAHIDVLEARPERTEEGVLPVAATAEDLQIIDPGTILPLETHRAVVGELLAGDFDLRGRWVSPPPRPKHLTKKG